MDEQVDVGGLTAVERELLRLGIREWYRSDDARLDAALAIEDDEYIPEACKLLRDDDIAEAARLLGYDDGSALLSDIDRLVSLLDGDALMTRRDFRRLLLATELAFASETLGWSRDWEVDTGFSDRDTITILRAIQERTVGIVYGSDNHISDLWGQPEPAWIPISMDADDEYWKPFCQRFDFRPGVHTDRPAIAEPTPSVTIDLSPIFSAASHPAFTAGANAVNSLALLAFSRALTPDTSLVVLDWQHQSYRFWPHRFACQPDQQWRTEVFPNGDYYIFLTEDMSSGTFGHPWQQTLCVFGEPLVAALVPLLTSWLPVVRTNL